jgi:hypothetical protein
LSPKRIKGSERRNKGKRLESHAVAPERNYDRETPVFCLRYVDPNYCITGCNAEQKAAFIDTMRTLSRITWLQIRFAGRRGLGTEKIDRDAINRPIPDHITEDEPILAVRFWEKARMVGYREREIFRIVWFDANYDLYDHGH